MSELTRMTFNLTEMGAAALDRLPGRDKTDRINRALRVAAIIEGLMTADRTLTILRDGKPVEVHIM